MYEHNFRTRITTGTFTFPVAALLTAALWILSAPNHIDTYVGLALAALATYLIVELNNRNSLLRLRSRMMGVVFLSFSAACPFFFAYSEDFLPVLALLLAYFPLFASYQQRQSAGWVFHAALCIGLGSLFYPPLLLLLPVFLLGMGIQLRSLNVRSLSAVFFGATLPYYFLVVRGVWEDRTDTIFLPYIDAFRFSAPDYCALSLPQILVGSLVILWALCAVCHFLRVAFNDKIRVRMLFYVIIIVEAVLVVGLLVRPQDAGVLLRLLIANSAPLIAHHLTLGRGRLLNIWFLVCAVLLLALIAFNTCAFYGVLS